MAKTPARRAAATSARTWTDVAPWLVRALWAALPFTAGAPLAAALHGASGPVRTLASAGLWAGWSVGVVAAFVSHPATLTALRVLAPAAAAAALLAAAGGHASPLAVAWTAVSVGWVMTPAVGFRWVNGPAYGDERRYLLRAPGPLLFGPLLVVWALALTGLSAGPLLLAARRWGLGVGLLVLGWPLAGLLLKSLHNLSRRWVVFVPAGLVLHDPVSLVDPVLFPRRTIVSMAPARRQVGGSEGGTLEDFRQRALGLALELAVSEPAPAMVVKPGRRQGETRELERLLFTPTRPGAVLDEARRRRLPRHG